MADGLKVFDALKEATESLPKGASFRVSVFDGLDLCKLTPADLVSRGYDPETAEAVSSDLMDQQLDALGESMGLLLEVDQVERKTRSLVPVDRLRETAGALADEEETLEQTFETLNQIRYGGLNGR